jgi:Flp pilus assembly pilin Flp
MNWMTRIIIRGKCRRGQTMTEYALILATVAAIVISLFRTSGSILSGLLTYIDNAL